MPNDDRTMITVRNKSQRLHKPGSAWPQMRESGMSHRNAVSFRA
jgi:hypothetical protein